MLPLRIARVAASRRILTSASTFTTSTRLRNGSQKHPDPAQPHLPSQTSTLGHDTPSVGKAPPPPEFLGKVAPDYKPLDAGEGKGLDGEVSGAKPSGHSVDKVDFSDFTHPPLERKGEDEKTMRARLVYQSRKRGILESDLLLSTFADTHLSNMTVEQMQEYDKFLDENDWDIYYWCTQDAPSSDSSIASPSHSQSSSTGATASPSSQASQKISSPPGSIGHGTIEQPAHHIGDKHTARGQGGPAAGEWAQTVGTVRQPYRPVPAKWANSDILERLRGHVDSRKAKGGEAGIGMGRMPDMKSY